jgi:DNA-binding transcriptional ArsR family regulator
MLHMNAAARLDATFAALAHPARRAILAHLSKGRATVAELAEPFDMTRVAISKHLRVLERAGLISSERDAQRRPRELTPERLSEAAQWLDGYRQFWEGSYQRLDGVLDELRSDRATPPKKRNQRSK